MLPDNSGAKVAIEHLVADAVQAEQLVVNPRTPISVVGGDLSGTA